MSLPASPDERERQRVRERERGRERGEREGGREGKRENKNNKKQKGLHEVQSVEQPRLYYTTNRKSPARQQNHQRSVVKSV